MHKNALDQIDEESRVRFNRYEGDHLALMLGICPDCGEKSVQDDEKNYFIKLMKSRFVGLKCTCKACGNRHVLKLIPSD